eukprot:scaffold23135_cov194-Cylindrotheca_fusiformis.AAC.2
MMNKYCVTCACNPTYRRESLEEEMMNKYCVTSACNPTYRRESLKEVTKPIVFGSQAYGRWRSALLDQPWNYCPLRSLGGFPVFVTNASRLELLSSLAKRLLPKAAITCLSYLLMHLSTVLPLQQN